jgi:crotonobetainyl-CoA:carnitine CoA-transferase CaiB-like acyl-CoA transferase
MLDGMISTMSSNYMSYLGSNVVPRPMGTGFPTVVPYRVFHAKDRSFSIAIGSEKLWSTFCAVIGHPELERRPEFESNAARIHNREKLEEILENIFSDHSAAEWVTKLQAAGIPSSLVRNFQEVTEHPQSEIREMFPTLNHPTAGGHRVTGTPVKLSETPGRPTTPAPRLGEHTKLALRDLLNLNESECDGLADRGVILETEPSVPPAA